MNLLRKIFPPIILIISFLLLIYTFYQSEIIWDGNNRNYYKTYYLIFSILICFSIITFFMNNNIKQYLIISIISFVVTLYLFEGYLVFTKQHSKNQLLKDQLLKEQLYEKQTGKKWDKRSKIEIYEDLKKNNDQFVMMVRPINFLNKNYNILPLSGISNSETIFCNENGYYATYKSDRYGFNNPDSEWDKKEIEYLLVGDSFAHGACVNRPNDIGSVLRKLSNKSVLNLGMSGNGPLFEYATLKEYLNNDIKKVLWIYYEGNDLGNLGDEKKDNILINYLNDLNFIQNLKLKQNEIDDLLIKFIKEEASIKKKLLKKKEIVSFLKLNNTREVLNNYLPKNQQPIFKSNKFIIDDFRKILDLTKNLIKQNNSKLYFIYLPGYNRYTTNNNTNYNLVKKVVTELKIPFIDIHKEVFEIEQNPLKLFPFELRGHYNIYGNKKVAETIYAHTKD